MSRTPSYRVDVIPPTSAVVVTVTAVTGSTIESALVFLDSVFRGYTDAGGRLMITGIEDGVHTIRATKSGYEEDSASFSSPETTSVTLTLRKISTYLHGHVIDAYVGHVPGIPGATVTCDGLSTTTDSEGYFRIDNVPTGTRTVRASAPGYESETRAVEIKEGENTIAFYLLPVAPPPTGALEGYVSIPSHPDAALNVCVVSVAGKSVNPDTAGHYKITGIDPGTYTATCRRVKCYESSQSVTIRSGETTQKDWVLIHV